MKKLVIIFVLLACVCVYAQTDDKTTLKTLNQKLVESYKNNKLDDALKFANQAVELSLKIYGTDNVETAVAYSNLGKLQREKQKYKDSITNLQKTVEIYQRLPNLDVSFKISAFDNLAISLSNYNKMEEAETYYIKAISIAREKLGDDSKESLLPLIHLATFYDRNKREEEADKKYLESFGLIIKHFGEFSEEFEKLEDTRLCLSTFVSQKGNENISREKIFQKRLNLLTKSNLLFDDDIVVNAKALLLPKPVYPIEARMRRLLGMEKVKIIVDENGDVLSARSVCGKTILGMTSEKAALKAKFSPTFLNGKVIKTSGIITYNFILK
jgi:tetratricopeptide (TPR) repeat protein